MIVLQPNVGKELFFHIEYQGIDLRNSFSRIHIPIHAGLEICCPGKLTNEGILISIPPLHSNILKEAEEKSSLTLEIITKNNEYFKIYTTDVQFKNNKQLIVVKEMEEIDNEEKIVTTNKKRSKLRTFLEEKT